MPGRLSGYISVLTATLSALLVAAEATAQAPKPSPPPPPATTNTAATLRQLQIANKPWTGDFDKLLQRRMLRVFAPFSRSLYFSDKGRERGLAVELVRDWERYLNIKYAKELGSRPLTVYVMPATRDQLLPFLADGMADVAIGNLTMTEERLKMVDFVPGDDRRRTINEVIVTGPKSPALKTLDDLSGTRVHVRKASSYYESLESQNERLKADRRDPITLIEVPDSLEDEDLMEMLDAGLVELLVVDDWKARMWAQVMPRLKVRTDLVLRADAKTGWAIIIAERIGVETTTYVRNIYKYYVAYRLMLDAQAESEKARQRVVPLAN